MKSRNLGRNKYAHAGMAEVSYRELARQVVNAGRADRFNVYMEFVKECPHASDDTKRKMRKMLKLDREGEIILG